MLYQCIFFIILSISLISIQIKYSILLDNPKGERHKINYNKNIPLSGGIYLFLSIMLSTFLTKYHNENYNEQVEEAEDISQINNKKNKHKIHVKKAI